MNSIIVPCISCNTRNRVPDSKQHLASKCGRCGLQLDLRSYAVPVGLDDRTLKPFLTECGLPVMVDFYSPNCGPCQALAPIIASYARRFFGRVVVATLDADLNPGSSAHYRIRGVPTLIFFKKGLEVDRIIGAPPENELTIRLEHVSNIK